MTTELQYVFKISDEIGGWTIKNRRNQYDILYLFSWIVGFLFGGGGLPLSPPDITYTLENKNTGATRTVTLSGVHKREDVIAAIAGLR